MKKSYKKEIISGIVIFVIFLAIGLLRTGLENNTGKVNFEGTNTRVYQGGEIPRPIEPIINPYEVVAIVDGVDITRDKLESLKRMGRVNESLAINTLINHELLYNEFKDNVSSEEIRDILEKQLIEDYSMTLEDFKAEVEKQGKDYDETYNELVNSIKKEIVVFWAFENFPDEIDSIIEDLKEKADIEVFI